MSKDFKEIFETDILVEPDISFDKISLITPSCKGVILFTDLNDNPIQLITAANIRRTVRAKLFTENDSENKNKKADLSKIVRKIYFIKTWCDFETSWKHYLLAKSIFQKTYKQHLNSYKSTFLTIDMSKTWPHFQQTESPLSKELVFGPFASSRDCRFYIEVITEAFNLCKNYTCLGNPDKAKSCPYLQMGLCDGVCIGKIERTEYIQRVKSAISAISDNSLITSNLNKKMQNLSSQMQFEQAGSVKSMIEGFTKKSSAFKWLNTVKDFSVLHIDLNEKIKIPGKKKKLQTFAGFLLKSGHIYKLKNFDINSVENLINTLKSIKPLPQNTLTKKQLKEQFNLIAYHLYRSNRKGLWTELQKINTENELKKSILEFIQEDD